MSIELIVFTHNDLDALGCMLNIEYKWPNVKKKYFHTNYANIKEIVAEILDYKAQNGNTHILIPDVSFSDNKESLADLYNAFYHCTHIDHHMYPDGFWDDFPNMKVVWDKKKSATLLCNEYLGNTGQNANLDKLTKIIDIYDLWQEESEYFDVAQDINEYFWKCGIEWLMNEIINNEFKLPKNFTTVVQQIHKDYEAAVEHYEKSKLIHRAGEITIAFVNDWFNQILIKEMRRGANFVIGVNSFGIVRVRINQQSPYTEQQLNKIRFDLTGNAEYGHLHAFTYKVEGQTSFDAIMAEVKKVVGVIEAATL